MNKQEIKNKIEELENELSKLNEELKKPENKAFYPKIGDIYYCLDTDGELLQYRWDDDSLDNMRYTIGNCFENKEEVEFEVERLKVIVELKRFAEEHNEPIDWKDRKITYYIAYDYLEDTTTIYFTVDGRSNDIYFSSKELAQQAVEQIGEERIKKYYLGVEDDE